MKRKTIKTPKKKQKERPDWFFLVVIMGILILLAISLNWFFSS